MVFNKIDLLPDPTGFAQRISQIYPGAVFASTMRTDGVDAIKAALRERAREGRPTMRVVIPEGDGARLAAVLPRRRGSGARAYRRGRGAHGAHGKLAGQAAQHHQRRRVREATALFVRKPGITGRKIRFALVGCGRISANHFDALATHAGEAELVGVADIDPAALERAMARTGAPGFPLAGGPPARIRSGPRDPGHTQRSPCPAGHPSRRIGSARHDREADGHALAGRQGHGPGLRRRRRALVRGEAEPRNPTLQLLKRAVEAKRFGRICMVSVNVFWSRPQAYYDSAAWRGTWEFDGGAFMNQASHYVDMLDWLIGPVESVQAYTATLVRNIEVEDTGVLALRWRAGTLGSLNVTMVTYPKNLEGSITVLARREPPGWAAWRSTGSSTGSSMARTRWTTKSSGPATRPPRCTATGTRGITRT
jgi:UDP-N-acetyl-2-amino-2-deoxyglucuronate dehydrogenase